MAVLLVISLVCYGLTTIYLLWALAGQHAIVKNYTLGQLFVGMLAHIAILMPKIATLYGLNFNLYNVISLTTFFMMLFFWGFCLYRPILPLGILATPLAIVGVLVGFFGNAPYHPLSYLSTLTQTHIVLSLASYSVLVMSAIQAVMLRIQIRELKHQTIHRMWVNKLPSLQSMESLLFDMITVGFVLLSFALAVGFIDMKDMFAQRLAHKTVFSILSWLIFGGLLVGHWQYGWRGVRASNMAIYGVALLILGFVGTKFVLEVILQR